MHCKMNNYLAYHNDEKFAFRVLPWEAIVPPYSLSNLLSHSMKKDIKKELQDKKVERDED